MRESDLYGIFIRQGVRTTSLRGVNYLDVHPRSAGE